MGEDETTPQEVTARVEILNLRGLHARASAKFGAVCTSWDAKVTVSKDGYTVGGSSIMGLMMLGAGPGSVIEITAVGPQAHEAIDTLTKLISDRFGEKE